MVDNHDFTQAGLKIGQEIRDGFTFSGAAHDIGQSLEKDIKSAAIQAGQDILVWVGEGLLKVILDIGHVGTAFTFITEGPIAGMATFIGSKLAGAIQDILRKWETVPGVISNAKGKAEDFWGILQKIANFFSNALTLHVNWPSPPSWLGTVFGLGGGGGPSKPTSVPPNVPSITAAGRRP